MNESAPRGDDSTRRVPLVIDFTSAWSGPQCTSVLADHGWEVVRIESASRPDVTRRLGPWIDGEPGLERSGYFATLNRGKKSVAINLSSDGGRAIARRLCEAADVVVENFSPRVMAKLGLTYGVLSVANPGLIMASISGYGSDGPEADYVAYGQTIEAVAGLDAATGYPDGMPAAVGAPIADHIAGMTAAGAIFAAMERRRRTGEGCWIDLSMVEALVALLPMGPIEAQLDGVARGPQGHADPGMEPHGCYPCAGDDRWIAIAVEDARQWRALAGVLRLGEALDCAELDEAVARLARRAELEVAVAAATRKWDQQDLQEALRAAGVPATGVLDGFGLRADSTLAARGFFQPVLCVDGRERAIPGRQAVASHLPRVLPGPAPLLGQHTADVLARVLGMSREDVDRLAAEGVLA